MFDDQKTRLLNTLDAAHAAYYKKEIFGGPSLYFHVQGLDACPLGKRAGRDVAGNSRDSFS
jgi:hypothetical protein